MIHDPIRELLKAEMPDLSWSVNNYTVNDNVGTVYNRSGRGFSRYEGRIARPSYQVLIRSTDKDKAELYAYKVVELLHRLQNVTMYPKLYSGGVPVIRYEVDVMLLENVGGINYLGLGEDQAAEYSINFDAVLNILNKEEL